MSIFTTALELILCEIPEKIHLFYIWIGLFVFKGLDFYRAQGDFFKLPVLYLVSGVLLFGIGQLHYLSEKLKSVARVYRLAGIKIAMVSLFFLTFRFFSGHYGNYGFFSKSLETSEQFTFGLILFSVVALLLAVIGLFFNPSKSSTNILENSLALGLASVALVFFFFPAMTNIYVLLFNLILAGLVFTLLFVGYQMVGGLILVLGGIALEKKRRQLKAKFIAVPTVS